MNREAIERLIYILNNVKPEKFSILSLFSGFGRRMPRKYILENECGTTACAVGLAALDPWFKNNGVSIEIRRNVIDGAFVSRESLSYLLNIDIDIFDLIFDYGVGVAAVEFYKIIDRANITPKMVVAKLQKILDAES